MANARAVAWIAVAATAGAFVAWTMGPASEAPPALPMVDAVPAMAVPVAAASVAPVPAASVPKASPLPTCPHEKVDLARAGETQRGCLAGSASRQTGSVRRLRFEPEGVSTWGLAVDLADGIVIAVRLSQPALAGAPAVRFECRQRGCGAARLGSPDAHGLRRLRLEGVALHSERPRLRSRRPLPEGPGTPPGPRSAETVVVEADLAVPPDVDANGAPCALPSLRVVEGDGRASVFCPLGGAGFEVADDGRLHFLFRDLDGRTLEIALTREGRIDKVTLGDRSCRAPACGGTTMDVHGDTPTDPQPERRFGFSGTSLSAASPPADTATLSGSVTMPAQ